MSGLGPEYKAEKDAWMNEGCLPPDEADARIKALAEDVKNGRVSEKDRRHIAANAALAYETGIFTSDMRDKALEAVRADDQGNLENPGEISGTV